jgi:hypothetical protein
MSVSQFEFELQRVFKMQTTDFDLTLKSGICTLSIDSEYYSQFFNLVCNRSKRLADFFTNANARVIFTNRALPVLEYPEEFDASEPKYKLGINCFVEIPFDYLPEIVNILQKF